MKKPRQITAYYDGSCPICDQEISVYKNSEGADNILWVNVANDEKYCLPAGITREQAMKRFYVTGSDGKIYSGALAFAEVWTSLSRFRPLGLIAKIWPISWILELGYRTITPVRSWFRRRNIL